MAEAARSFDSYAADAVAPPVSTWSGEVHGPVAALHQAIEAGLIAGRLGADPAAPAIERPIDHALRIASRTVGWAVLAAAFVAAVALIL